MIAGSSLPNRFPIFPLPGAVLLPGGELPLNIFESRYLQMTRDAMQTDRVIGMIQPKEEVSDPGTAPVYTTGCAGSITNFEETEDGRFLIVLAGVCRFDVVEELAADTPYRQVVAGFERWLDDLNPAPLDTGRREALMTSLETYLRRAEIDIDWDALGEVPLDGLVTSLAMICPFESNEKQALVEAPDGDARMETLITLMDMHSSAALMGDAARH